KKIARPADPAGGAPPGLGAGLPGRDLVVAAGAAGAARLGGRWAAAPGGADRGQGRPGPQGAGLLRAVAGGHGPDAGALRGGGGVVEGRPVSVVTEDFLGWVCRRLGAEGKKVLVLIWDNASWHVSKRVRAWIKAHNRRAKRRGGVRILACYLPIKSPWLNAIE